MPTIEFYGRELDALAVSTANKLASARSDAMRKRHVEDRATLLRELDRIEERRAALLRDQGRTAGTAEDHDAATNKSVSVQILGTGGAYQLEVIRRSRWEGEEPETRAIEPATYPTLDQARMAAEAECQSRYGDPWRSW